MKNIKFKILIYIFVFLPAGIFAQNIMSIGNYSGNSLDTITVSLDITNSQNFTAYQTDIQLPAQVKYLNGSALLTARANGHSLSASLLDNNVLRIITFSITQNNFNGNSGSVLDFKIILNTQPGNYSLQLSNCIISDSSSHNILTSSSDGSIIINAPDISVSSNILDFSRTPLNNYTDRSFTIYNNGNSNLNISRIFTDNIYFQIIGDTSFTINSGSSKNVIVRFNSLKKGNYNSHLIINSNDPNQTQTNIKLTAISFAVNELHMQNVSGRSGYPVSITFSINNMESFAGFQFDMLLPSVLSFIKDSVQLSKRKDDHIVSANLISPGRLRVLAFSPTNKSFHGNDGDIITLNFMLKGTGGNYLVNLDSVIITDSAASNIISNFYTGSVNIKSPSLSSASNFSFPDAAVTDTSSFIYRIDNYGNDTLNINDFSSQQNYFWNTTQLPQVIPPGGYQNFDLKFHNTQKGSYNGSFTIRSNDPLKDPFEITSAANSFAPNYIIAENTNAFPGDTAIIKIDVQNYESSVALQVDLQVPDSLTYINNSGYLTNRSQGHTLSVGSLGNNRYKILVFSLTQSPFVGDFGALVVLKFKVGNVTGNFPLSLSNGILSNASSQNILKSTRDGTLSLNGLPGIINLISPLNGSSNVLLNSNLNWSAGSNSSSYEVQAALDSLFNSVIIDSSGLTNTSLQLSHLANSTKYFWRVRGFNLGNPGNWSDIWNFTTIIASPLSPTLAAPTNGSTGVSVTPALVWNKSNTADSYTLQVSTSSTFATTILNQTGITDTTFNVTGLSNSTQYYWRVSASNTGGTSDWSTAWNFTTIVAPAGVPQLISPTNGSTGISITPKLIWHQVVGANSYNIQVSTSSGFGFTIVDQNGITDTTLNITGLSNSTQYYWRVSATNVSGTSSWSTVWNFTTIVSAPQPPILVTPANGSTGVSVTPAFVWNKSNTAASYTLQVSTSSNLSSTIVNQTGITDTTYNVTGLSNSTQYYWRVNAANAGGTSGWSTTWSFTTIIAAPPSPTLVIPTNGSTGVSVTPTLVWNKSNTAASYTLQVSASSNFSSTIVNQSGITDTTYNVTGLSNSTQYYWRVRATNVSGTSSWSTAWNFTTIISAPAAPVLLSPANNAVNQPTTLALSWNASTGANSYRLQVSTDAGFNTVLFNDSTITTTSKQITGLNNGTQYYWRVSAINAGDTSPYSDVWNFTTIITFSISGTTTYNNLTSTPLNNVSIKLILNNNPIDSVITNSQGYYIFNNLENGTYQLKAATTNQWGGVNSTDALVIKRHVVGFDTLSGLKFFAADVNASGTVNSTDALTIQRRVIGLTNNFITGDWVFENPSVTLNGNNVIQDIKALAFGDVNGSYIPGMSKVNASVDYSNKGIIKVNPKSEFELPVEVSKEIELGAIFLVIKYPENSIEVENVTSKFGGLLYNCKNGKILISWSDIESVNIKSGESIVTLKLKSKGELKEGSSINFIIDPASEIADKYAKVITGIGLNIPLVEASLPKEYKLSQNYPNPFNPSTTIKYELPEQAIVTLEIFNSLGEKVLMPENTIKDAGSYDIVLNLKNFSSGVYIYRITAHGKREFTQVRKMLLLK